MVGPIGIAEHAARAGWRGSDLVVSVAVAMAESSGNEKARNTKGGADSRGLWQINVAAGAHPDMAGQNLYDPAVNAKAAYSIWQRSGWGPWDAHKNKAYLLYMPAAGAGVLSPTVQAIVAAGVVDGVAGQLPGADMLDAAKNALTLGYKTSAWVGDRNNWVRVAYVVAGLGLMWGGLLVIARGPTEKVTGAVLGGVTGKAAGAVRTIAAKKSTGGAK